MLDGRLISAMRIRASCNLELHLSVTTPLILILRPQSGASQWVSREEYTFSEPVKVLEYPDIFGNLCQRLLAPAGVFKTNTTAEVETADAMDVAPGAPFINVQELPESVLSYLVPTRYCESDRLGEAARQIVTGSMLGYDQVQSICDWIRGNIPYAPGTSSIPARMVVEYLHGLEPMDLHAWFEAYVGDRWYTFDPSQDHLTGGRVSIAYGRDATELSSSSLCHLTVAEGEIFSEELSILMS